MFRRVVTLFCACVMLVSVFTGCEQSKKQDTGAQTAGKDSGAPDFSQKIKFSFAIQDGQKYGVEKDEMYKFLQQKFNVDIEFVPFTANDRAEKVKLWVASGNMPDVTTMDFQYPDFGQYVSYVKQGVLKPLPELGSKYPNLQKGLEHNDTMKNFISKMKVDGKLYAYFLPWITPEGFNPYVDFGIVYRKDWAAKVGFNKTEATWDEIAQLSKDIIAKDPGGLGAGKTIGLVSSVWTGVGLFEMLFSTNPDYDMKGFVKKDGKYVWNVETNKTAIASVLKDMKKAYDEGVFYKDFYTAKDANQRNLFYSGNAAIMFGNVRALNNEQGFTQFEASNPGIKASDAFGTITLKDKDGRSWSEFQRPFFTASMFPSNIDDKKLERILYIMDWFAGDEGLASSFLGIKGKDWDMENGKYVTKYPKGANGKEIKPYIATEATNYRIFGQGGSHFNLVNPNYSDFYKKFVTDYNKRWEKTNVKYTPLDFDLLMLSAPNKNKVVPTLLKETQDFVLKTVINSKDVDKDLDQFITAMKPKIDPVVKEINDALAKK